MKSLLLLVCALWIAAGAGRLLMGRLTVLRGWPLERFVYSAALGLAAAAYGVFALGLVGLLSFWPITAWWLFLAAIGMGGMIANAHDLRDGTHAWMASLRQGGLARVGYLAATLALILCAGIAVLACFLPPGGPEWDALAYHLADPKLFLEHGRIVSLPTEHHSNFPFTMEMLFTVGLLYDGYALASLFHFLMAALTALALIAFCARRLTPAVGYLAAVIFAATPLVVWEAHAAYIDLGLGLFATLAAFAAVSAVGEGDADAGRSLSINASCPDALAAGDDAGAERSPADQRRVGEWALLAGAAMGFALGIKYLALVPFALVGLLLVLRRAPWRAVAVYAGLALALAAPWYIKNLVLVHNPVYPYFYKAFPQSRYWSADRAATYESEQKSFGVPRTPDGQARNPQAPLPDELRSLAQIPWYVLIHPGYFTNTGNNTFMEQLGGLYAAFGFALVFVPGVPRSVREVMLLGVAQLVAWFFVAQISRYLISILPLLAVGAGYAAWRLSQPARSPAWLRVAVVGALAGQMAVLLWGVFALPTRAQEAREEDVPITSLSVPEVVSALTQPQGAQDLLSARLETYRCTQWINKNTPPKAGVILYDETRGFYLDRNYLWGNGEHSAYIPYETMRSGEDLTRWLLAHGYQYALINLRYSPERSLPSSPYPFGPKSREETEDALRLWYEQTKAPPGSWRRILGDALRSGGWQVECAENGVVALRIGEAPAIGRTVLTPPFPSPAPRRKEETEGGGERGWAG
ncbi:MAG TPA: hypothetical protein VFB38_15215 [Chthonomonadaceae bacterium]|nr:hypothetical protein [Chthonomonadaceae bacterium]